MNKKIPSFLTNLFWDYDFRKLDLVDHFAFIAVRILEKGGVRELSWLLNNFSHESIDKVVYNSVNITIPTKRFWHVFYSKTP